MNEKTQANRGRLVPLLLGLVAGALLAAIPIGNTALKLQAQLDTANSNIAQLQAGITQLQQERVQLGKRDLPVQVSFRHGVLSAGLVLTLHNVSRSELAVSASFSREGASPQSRQLVLPPDGVREVGEREGWAFVTGDTVVLTNPSFREWRGSAPQT
jgi:hypothetical protein